LDEEAAGDGAQGAVAPSPDHRHHALTIACARAHHVITSRIDHRPRATMPIDNTRTAVPVTFR
jgi:hypothetical protein